MLRHLHRDAGIDPAVAAYALTVSRIDQRCFAFAQPDLDGLAAVWLAPLSAHTNSPFAGEASARNETTDDEGDCLDAVARLAGIWLRVTARELVHAIL
jgi:hypothetical protein